MRVDAHQHFWTYDAAEYGWIVEGMGCLKRDFGPPQLAPLLARHGFAGSIAVQARQSGAETEALLRASDANAFVLGVVGWVDLRSSALRDELERFKEHPRFVGVRHVIQDEPDERFLLREDFLAGVEALKELDLTYDVLVYPRQLPATMEFVRRLSEHRLVLDHIAKPAIGKGELEPWASAIRELAKSENLFCKVSGLVTEANWEAWEPEDFTPYLDVVFESFGTTRLMFGSDWPVCTLAADYQRVVEIVADYIGRLSIPEQDAVMGENARRFYGLAAST